MKPFMVQESKSLREVCTLGIGGIAAFYVEVYTKEDAFAALQLAHERRLPFHVLGKGSNSLFSDGGFPGILIHNKIDFFKELSPGRLEVGAGYSFSLLGAQTARNGWSGLEFASGIPGSVGGAVCMNAGANGTETANALAAVEFMHADGRCEKFIRSELTFSYRTSIFQKIRGLIIGAEFLLTPSPQARSHQLAIIERRKSTQPLTERSAGCIFRNPPNQSAGALIEKSGLKGLQIGGAKISEKHANFIINRENASCEDVLALISLVQQKVKEVTHIELECEICCIPENKKEN